MRSNSSYSASFMPPYSVRSITSVLGSFATRPWT
ncbi:Uncharacterised protein [Mycobacteroides abscessus]|nr:Uncharacterised protein [Mycobacteroides abscessus]